MYSPTLRQADWNRAVTIRVLTSSLQPIPMFPLLFTMHRSPFPYMHTHIYTHLLRHASSRRYILYCTTYMHTALNPQWANFRSYSNGAIPCLAKQSKLQAGRWLISGYRIHPSMTHPSIYPDSMHGSRQDPSAMHSLVIDRARGGLASNRGISNSFSGAFWRVKHQQFSIRASKHSQYHQL